METRETLLERLDEAAARLLDFYRGLSDSNVRVYELWSAKDVLAHLTFWHESFARNVGGLAQGKKPAPLKGKLGDLNQAGVDEMRPYPLDTVIERFEAAHQIIRQNILDPRLSLIPYRRCSRDYTPEEHLSIVNDHIQFHLKDVTRNT
jgi:hypothetical protein